MEPPSRGSGGEINELLARALARASEPGHGDEEPEVLPAMDSNEIHGKDNSMMEMNEEERRLVEENIEKQRLFEEEERKVAELKFDKDLLLPFENMAERAKYIPLRLSYEERKSLRLVNAAINVSDYTNNVDMMFKNNAKRHHSQLQYIVAFISGLIAANNYQQGQEVLTNRNFSLYEQNIQDRLEIARRYKITNPEKMRSEYGKLVYLMQDSVSPTINQLLGISIVKPIITVHSILESLGGLQILEDPHIATATAEILPDKSKSRPAIQLEIKRKEHAINKIVKTYSTRALSEDTIKLCLYSICDNNSFLNSNRKPITDTINLLHQYFKPDTIEPGYELSINEGSDGARLSHSHELQYNYVLQSLTLWEAILDDMFRLWYLAEMDLIGDGTNFTPYELKNTGQGLQRVQQSPRVYRAMHEILAHTKNKLDGWVGSSVIHVGDNNVPNTLLFIDKYTQVARILAPLVNTLNNIETACSENEGISRYIDVYGGIEKAKKDILHDFFTHGFDGSGGDNFFEAGSCIDGRLTSAWNWCSQLPNKPYYPLFRLTGFLSFDGQFES